MKKQIVSAFFGMLTAIVAFMPTRSFADEGMWTFHNPPLTAIAKKYNVNLTPEWLDNLRLSAVRFGASSAFVSADGLILTNHHVALGCVQRLSSAKEDLVRDGFLARTNAEERVCPGAEASQLLSFEDVTGKVAEAKGNATKRQDIISDIEKSCREATKLRCQVVTLYRGGQYWLYRYKIWQDVRLVWAPEARLGFFGGDRDNFVYPRYALDVAFVRAYEDGKPVKTAHYLRVAQSGPKEGDVVFSAGNPGSTDRALTSAELNFLRQQWYPIRLNNLEDARDNLIEFGKQNAESQRRANDPMFGIENSLKAVRGEAKALAVDRLHQRKRTEEQALREEATRAIAAGTFKFQNSSDPWAAIEDAAKRQHRYAFEMAGTEYGRGTLLRVANDAIALTRESALPAGERLSAYRDALLPQIRRQVLGERVWYLDLEEARLAQKIDEAMGYLGREHKFVARMLRGAENEPNAPQAAARRIMAQTNMGDAAFRKALVDGGEAAIVASNDSLVALVRDLYPIWRQIRARDQREIEAVKEAAHDDIARLKFHLKGVAEAPDATGTLRFSFGRLAGFDRDGIQNAWMTSFHGLYERNLAFENKPPFDLPERWLAAKPKLELATPYNVVSTLDIIGGSSGSPMVNTKGEVVGVLFDGNLDGLGNRFQYQDRSGRALAVDMRAVIESLNKVYGATALVSELTAHWKTP